MHLLLFNFLCDFNFFFELNYAFDGFDIGAFDLDAFEADDFAVDGFGSTVSVQSLSSCFHTNNCGLCVLKFFLCVIRVNPN